MTFFAQVYFSTTKLHSRAARYSFAWTHTKGVSLTTFYLALAIPGPLPGPRVSFDISISTDLVYVLQRLLRQSATVGMRATSVAALKVS